MKELEKIHTITDDRYFTLDYTEVNENDDTNNLEDVKLSHDLSIYKTLSSNVPKIIDIGLNQIHFTAKGEIFINDIEGTLVKCGGDNGGSEVSIEFATTEDIDNLLNEIGFLE